MEKRLFHKIKAIDYLGTTCSSCGQAYHHSAMQFHHLRPSEKDHKISTILGRHSWDNILSELRKCGLMCANCHAVYHYKENKNE
jgi:uncharacterized OB-fold protein